MAAALTRDQIATAIADNGIFPCWRTDDTDGVIDATKALFDVGMNNVELTMTTPGNLRLIERARKELPAQMIVGAGTVYDTETARMAILAGAQYIVSPVLAPDIVEICHRYGVMAVISAFTPTEVLAAKNASTDMIKLHPCGGGGPAMLFELRGPFPGVRLIATGGVLLGDIANYMTAGVDAIVVGIPHLAKDAYRDRDFPAMQRVAKKILAAVREGRDPERMRQYADDILRRYVDFENGNTRVAKASR
jgi:2-dehydro-3-deoxyphosphogluconate aldolase / (4S)-4-hydroxy-2-oxoglutarate aldolase